MLRFIPGDPAEPSFFCELGGTGSTGSGRGGTVFTPGAQPGADTAFQNIGQNLIDQSLGGLQSDYGGLAPRGNPAVLNWPQVYQASQDVVGNPFAGTAIDAAQQGSNIFTGEVLPTDRAGAATLSGFGGAAGGLINPALASTFGNPAYADAATQGRNINNQLSPFIGRAIEAGFNPAFGQAGVQGANAANTLFGAGDQSVNAGQSILNTGFDPQNALYNRTRSQLTDQANASNAAAGLSSSPYGASTVSNALGNFDINWQNNLLNREATAGNAAAGLFSGGSGLYGAGLTDLMSPATAGVNAAATGLSAAEGAANAGLSSLLTPANNLTAATTQGTGALGNLSGIANQSFGGASSLLGGGATGATTFGAAPYTTANTIAGNKLGALSNANQLGLQQYALPQQTLNDIESYLGLGQSASNIANTVGATNFNQTAAGLGGLGNLAGQAFGGGGGLSGLLGAGGNVGGDFGGGGAALGIADSVANTTAGGGGFLESLTSALPFAASA